MQRFRLLILALGVFVVSSAAASATTFSTFTDQALFLSQLGAKVTDSYDDEGYTHGDVLHIDGFPMDIFSDAAMTGVVGETIYESTTFTDLDIIQHDSSDGNSYCAGCNGSFRLTFTSTSVGGPDGVYGVGFAFSGSASPSYLAYVGFGDGTFENVPLPLAAVGFFGITSPGQIRTIHFGLPDGVPTAPGEPGQFGLDELTIGAAPGAAVPEPGSMGLLGLGLLALVSRRAFSPRG